MPKAPSPAQEDAQARAVREADEQSQLAEAHRAKREVYDEQTRVLRVALVARQEDALRDFEHDRLVNRP
jgi:hypothetical protein